jgi:hypothetical protein
MGKGNISPDVKTDSMETLRLRYEAYYERNPFLMEVISLEGGMSYFILPLITPRLQA